MRATGEKASPLQQTKRRFSKNIEEEDEGEIASIFGGPLRDGRVVTFMFCKEDHEGGGWFQKAYESCGE